MNPWRLGLNTMFFVHQKSKVCYSITGLRIVAGHWLYLDIEIFRSIRFIPSPDCQRNRHQGKVAKRKTNRKITSPFWQMFPCCIWVESLVHLNGWRGHKLIAQQDKNNKGVWVCLTQFGHTETENWRHEETEKHWKLSRKKFQLWHISQNIAHSKSEPTSTKKVCHVKSFSCLKRPEWNRETNTFLLFKRTTVQCLLNDSTKSDSNASSLY